MKRLTAFLLVALIGWNIVLTILYLQSKEDTTAATAAQPVSYTHLPTPMTLQAAIHWISQVMIYHFNGRKEIFYGIQKTAYGT